MQNAHSYMHEQILVGDEVCEACSEIKKASGILMRQIHETGVKNKT